MTNTANKSVFMKAICIIFAFIFAVSGLFIFKPNASADEDIISVTATTNKTSYAIKDTVILSVTVSNIADKTPAYISAVVAPVTSEYYLTSGNGPINYRTIPMGESTSRDFELILSNKADNLNIFQKIILFFRNLFYSKVKSDYEYDGGYKKTVTVPVTQGKYTRYIKVVVYYDISYFGDYKDNIKYDYSYDKESLCAKTNERIGTLCKNKGYNERIRQALVNTFDRVINKYDTVTDIFSYCSILPCEEYIDNILKTLEIRNINIILTSPGDIDYKKNMEELNKLGASGYYGGDEIMIDYSDPENAISVVFEEILHSTQENVSCYDGSGLSYVFTEGDATYSRCFFFDEISYNRYDWVENDNYLLRIYSTKASEEGTVGKYYVGLCCLIGFDNLMDFKNVGYEDKLIDCINVKCGIDGEKLIDLINEEEDYGENSYEIENLILEGLYNKAETISSGEEAKSFFNMYRYYKLQYKLTVKAIDEGYNDITNDIIHYADLEELLESKLIQYNIIDNSSDFERLFTENTEAYCVL